MSTVQQLEVGDMTHAGPASLLEFLRQLPDNWDGADAPKPTPGAIMRAETVFCLVKSGGVQVTDVDADALGGVALWLAGPTPKRSAWLSFMNDGTDTLVLSDNGKVTHQSWNEYGQCALAGFLQDIEKLRELRKSEK